MSLSQSDSAQLVYLYDGTLEGLLSAVLEAYINQEYPIDIVTEHNLQESLLCSYIPLTTNLEYAQRVQTGILDKLDYGVYNDIKRVFLSEDSHKGVVILRYIRHVMSNIHSAWVRGYLANPAVADFESILQVVNNEAEYMRQFIRFALLQNGVFYSRIEPKANVIPIIMDYFAERYNVQPFIIHDARHKISGVYDMQKWWLVDAENLKLPANSDVEDDFQSLWQTFFDTIAIKERTNPTCQRNFMPKRFWGNMCEQIPRELRRHNPQTSTPTEAAKAARLLNK
jgi:probable DNA metabolism protein